MEALVGIAVATLIAIALGIFTRTRYGELRLMEIPGTLWVTLAGRQHRAQMAEILDTRKSECQ